MIKLFDQCVVTIENMFSSFTNYDLTTHPFEKPPLFRRKQYIFLWEDLNNFSKLSIKLIEDNLTQVTCIAHLVHKKEFKHIILDGQIRVNTYEVLHEELKPFISYMF